MRVACDTNVLLRVYDVSSPLNPTAELAIDTLMADGIELCICTQNLVEFWAVSTRPAIVNGLDLTPMEAQAAIASFRTNFSLLAEPPDIADLWLDLVTRYQVSGKPTHDARLVALMLGHGVTRILTFNADDFRRFAEVTVIDPRQAPPP